MKRLTEKRYGENGHYLVCSVNCDRGCGEDCDNLVGTIEHLAAIEDILGDEYDLNRLRELVEVRHGRWFFTEYEFFTCSVCGESYYNGAESTAQAESYLNSGHTYKYCPNCGTRMDKEDEHEVSES